MTDAFGLAVRRLTEEDDFSAFDSGDADLNDFIRSDARRLERLDVTRVYVALAGDRLAGYIAVLTDTVVLKKNERKKLELADDSKNIPAVKVGRLAVDSSFQRRGIGEVLMRLAYNVALATRNPLGCRLLTVDAYKASEGFYAKLGFVRNKVSPAEETCPKCKQPLDRCPHCAETWVLDDRTISMRFDLKVDPLPAWAS